VTASISVAPSDTQRYLLRIADTALIHAQRLMEWCGHAPVLEEDLALANLGLDLLGQARALLTHVGTQLGLDEDQLAYLRDERDFLNLTLVELPGRRGGADFADTQLRNLFVAGWLFVQWQRLLDSSDPEAAAIAAKAVKETRYHVQHAGDWVVRLGDGTPESAQRLHAALDRLWPYVAEMFDDDAVDAAAESQGLGPRASALAQPWHDTLAPYFDAAGLAWPETPAFRSTGRQGQHSEHLGPLLAEMQHLQRAYPGGQW
jgi:ring-1,2-phenylacetyl-CoA epoxidase subunit PaaC